MRGADLDKDELLAKLDAPEKVGGEAAAPDEVPVPPQQRKIIYTAQVNLIVDDFDTAQQALTQLIRDQKAYIAKSDVRGSSGAPRQGTWTIRVPTDHFDAVLAALSRLGELQQSNLDSQDVSDEYYDLDARIKNKKVEEERLLRHLDKSTGKLEDILAVEREISRVRGEVERLQGRMKYLAQLTALTTITITVNERKGYVPPAAPTFSTTIGRTFGGSLDALLAVGKALLLVAVALVPWLPVMAVLAVLGWLLVRRAARPQPPGQPVPASPVQPG
jgi:hypothetical protein